MYFKFLKYRLFLIHCACNTEVGRHSLIQPMSWSLLLKETACMINYDFMSDDCISLYIHDDSTIIYDDCIYIYIYVYLYLQSDYTFRIKIKFQDTVQREHPCKS